MKRVIISGRAMSTPKSMPLRTRVYCAGCEKHYEIDTNTLMIEGFACACACGKLEMAPRFATKGNGEKVYKPRFGMASVPRRKVGRGRGR